ncbi:hypothetical protein [Micromonospora sp. LOL_015]|uniref:hypothetical protein n=1 Tax=Micromonospora sp. LOL_015 TaxID=3345416 RepID=UPI003A881045
MRQHPDRPVLHLSDSYLVMVNSATLRVLAPGVSLIILAEAAAIAAWTFDAGPSGFAWMVAALVAGFSLSGSV